MIGTKKAVYANGVLVVGRIVSLVKPSHPLMSLKEAAARCEPICPCADAITRIRPNQVLLANIQELTLEKCSFWTQDHGRLRGFAFCAL